MFRFLSKCIFNLKTEVSYHIKSDNLNNGQNCSTVFNSATKDKCFNKHPRKMKTDKEIRP